MYIDVKMEELYWRLVHSSTALTEQLMRHSLPLQSSTLQCIVQAGWQLGRGGAVSFLVIQPLIINCSHQHTCYAECIEAQLQMVTPQPQHCSSQVQVQ